jgi:hypothetical protein
MEILQSGANLTDQTEEGWLKGPAEITKISILNNPFVKINQKIARNSERGIVAGRYRRVIPERASDKQMAWLKCSGEQIDGSDDKSPTKQLRRLRRVYNLNACQFPRIRTARTVKAKLVAEKRHLDAQLVHTK